MENYTIDLAQLSRPDGDAGTAGSREDIEGQRRKTGSPRIAAQKEADVAEESEGNAEDFMSGYRIDLGGLGDKPSSVVVEDREEAREEVPSEDDGPEDFTMNLEKWIRGNKKWEKPKPEKSFEGGKDEDGEDGELEHSPENGLAEESIFEPQGTSTPAPPKDRIYAASLEHRGGGSSSQELCESNAEIAHDQTAEEVFQRISALQAELERMRAEEDKIRAIQKDVQDENRRLNVANADLKAKLDEHHRELTRNHGAEKALHELEALRGDAKAKQRASDVDIKALEVNLQSSRNELQATITRYYSAQEEHNVDVANLRAELEERNLEVTSATNRIRMLANEIAKLNADDSRKRREIDQLSNELSTMQSVLDYGGKQLQETRRIVETVEDENEALTEENDNQAQQISELADRLEVKSVELQAAQVTIARLQETSQNNDNFPKVLDEEPHEKSLEEAAAQHAAALSSLKENHTKELKRLHTGLQKVSQGVKKREADTAKKHADQLTSLHQELATLKHAQDAAPSPPNDDIETELRSAIRVLSSQLRKANSALSSARTEAEEARQTTINIEKAHHLVNAEMEKRFAETVEAREREWMRRVDLLLRERETMGKALLLGWGREEVGETGEGGQRYRYMYLKGGA